MKPTLAIICLLPLLILVPINIKLIKPIKLRQFQYVKELGLTNNNIQETFDGIEIIKAYNLQKKMEDKYYKALKKTFDTSNHIDLSQYNIEPLSRAIQEVPLAIALCLGGSLVFSGNITMGILIALISTIKKLIDPLSSAYQLIVRSQTAMVCVSRVFDIIDTPAELNTTQDLVTNKKTENVLTFNNVSFSYKSKEATKTIDNVSFSIKKGTKVAFVGKSGGGKSTILKLISRQLEIDEGSIDYYGVKYSDSAPDQIRRHLALIAQDTDIFSMSIADNVRIGNPKATPEQIMEALRLAGCDDFIRDMPDGMNCILTEKGSNLSGGQRQRIAIARAILKGAPVILLDEPTAALDKTTENYICQTIHALAKDKTVITVAHRLNTIKDYDVIFVVDGGRIVEQGNHNELMDKQELYYQMYREFEK
jgi:ABC-type multidrug transport system fused ATPase/permease subunit